MAWEWVGEGENRRMDSVDFKNDYKSGGLNPHTSGSGENTGQRT